MRNQTDTVRASKENTAYSGKTAYSISGSIFVHWDILRSVKKRVWQENVVEVSILLVGRGFNCIPIDWARASKKNATVMYTVRFVPLEASKTFCIFFIDHGHTSVSLPPVADSETCTGPKNTVLALKRSDTFLSPLLTLLDELSLTNSRAPKDTELKMLYKAMHKVQGSLNNNER